MTVNGDEEGKQNLSGSVEGYGEDWCLCGCADVFIGLNQVAIIYFIYTVRRWCTGTA